MYEEELALAKRVCLRAGEMLARQGEVIVDSMEGKDIKLAVDKLSERLIIEGLMESNIPILSEEEGFVKGSEKTLKVGKLWIIDPLDGSANYWKNMRELSCVSVALWDNGQPVLGVINRFDRRELYVGVVGAGAWKNDEPIHTSTVNRISDAVLATGFPLRRSYDDESLTMFVKQVQHFKKIRMLGAAAVMGSLVSCGHVDVYTEEGIMLWDIAAASAIVTAAGGIMEIEMQTGFRCICRLFANEVLKTEFYKTLL